MNGTTMKVIDLNTIGGGVLPELFQKELSRVLDNIRDINTDPKAKREIKISLEFKPDEARNFTQINIKCSSKVSSTKPASGQAFIVMEKGEVKAYAHDVKQEDLFENNVAQFMPTGEKNA